MQLFEVSKSQLLEAIANRLPIIQPRIDNKNVSSAIFPLWGMERQIEASSSSSLSLSAAVAAAAAAAAASNWTADHDFSNLSNNFELNQNSVYYSCLVSYRFTGYLSEIDIEPIHSYYLNMIGPIIKSFVDQHLNFAFDPLILHLRESSSLNQSLNNSSIPPSAFIKNDKVFNIPNYNTEINMFEIFEKQFKKILLNGKILIIN